MANYPPERESAANSDADGNEEEEEEDAVEEAMEELAEWTELMPLAELEAMEDGPSTYLVGSYSTCQHLGDAIDFVKYKEDVVVVFPGVYTKPRQDATTGQALVLNEAHLGGLRVCGVDYAREHGGAAGTAASASIKASAPSKRRAGPWFTWLTAAAAATLLTQEGGGVDNGVANPLKTAASRAVAATEARGTTATAAAVATTTSGSSVFAPAITTTTANPAVYPVFDFPISVVYDGSAEGDETAAVVGGGLVHYKQVVIDDEAAEEDDGEDGSTNNNNNNDGDGDEDEVGAGSESQAGKTGKGTAVRTDRAITLAGCCARGGLSLDSLTRTTVTHCVVGSPQQQQPSSSSSSATALRIAIRAAPLTEAVVDHCLVYGGTAYGVYAYPRAALSLQSCLVEGPNAEAAKVCGGGSLAEHFTARNVSAAHGVSVMDELERRHARALRQRAFLQRGEAADGDDGSSSSGGSAYVDVEEGVLPRFITPQTITSCEVGVMCDDADVHMYDCLVSHVRLGVLLHGGCAGTKMRCLDIRSCSEAGLYVYGVGGAAEVVNSAVRACGRACLLLVGPSAAEVAQARAALGGTHGSSADEDVDDDAINANGGAKRHRPVFEQHPYIKSNTFIGAVRVQGEVRSGAVVDNFVFLPKEEKESAATAAQSLLLVDATARRGFTYVGVEGDRVTGRVSDATAAAAM
jgi:hypothetical protein